MANNKMKASVKPVILLIASFLGILAISFFYVPFFTAAKVLYPIFVTPTVAIDLYGLVLPLIVVLSCTAVYIKQSRSKIGFAIAFLCCLLIALFTSQVTTDGLRINAALFSLVASLLVTSVSASLALIRDKAIKFKSVFVSSLLLGSICIPLAMILIDIYSLQFYAAAVIGGNGLADGILLSTLYSPLAITFEFSILELAFSVVNQIKLFIKD